MVLGPLAPALSQARAAREAEKLMESKTARLWKGPSSSTGRLKSKTYDFIVTSFPCPVLTHSRVALGGTQDEPQSCL